MVHSCHRLALGKFRGGLEISTLDLKSCEPATILERESVLQRGVVRNRVDLADRIGERQFRAKSAGLDDRQDQGGAAHLQISRGLGEIGISDDHVEASVTLRVRMRLVSRVDDGALERGLQAHFHFEEVRTLRELESSLLPLLTAADASGPGKNLARDEEGSEVAHDVGEGRTPSHEVVLMTPVRGTLVVGVVLVELNSEGTGARGCLSSVGHDFHAGSIPQHRVTRIGDLGARVLGVSVIDVQPRPIREDEIGKPEIVIGELARVGLGSRHVIPAGVAQRVFLVEVPSRAMPPVPHRDSVVRRDHRR